ncbi:AAA family ATPase [Nonomuraea angiospora]|uniref:LuxR C-terminal-related transcriptional regulator n=1 Tax=Nonomuraea angiospora TaxID=46172 RepID=UPI003434722C
MLHGRVAEKAEIDRLLRVLREGGSGALVIAGEVGIGKSALVEYAAEQARGMELLRTTGVESEAELPFAGLHLLLKPVLGRVDALPSRQAAALRGAFGLGDPPGENRFLVGLATLTLLSDLAIERPLLCLIDDAHWLDRPSIEALTFTARRLGSEGIALIFAVRDGERDLQTLGMPGLRLGALARPEAAALLAEHAPDLAPHVRDRLLDDAEGNPLALVELPRRLTPEQRAGNLFPLDIGHGVLPPAGRVRLAFESRIDRLPEPSKAILLVASADASGDLEPILRAADMFGASIADLDPVQAAGLITLDGRKVLFRHPLIRTVALQAAPFGRRIAAHRALAIALTGDRGGDRRAWHLAAAATGPDDQAAAELEAAAERARATNGYAAAGAAYERAAELTGEVSARARRLGAAAALAVASGRLDRAVTLAEAAADLTGTPSALAELDHVRAVVEAQRGSPEEAGHLLITGAERIAGTDPGKAAAMLVEAVRGALLAGSPAVAGQAVGRLRRLSAPPESFAFRFGAAMTEVVDFFTGRQPGGFATARAAIAEARRTPGGEWSDRLSAACIAFAMGDSVASAELAGRLVEEYRAHGMVELLPGALELRAQARLFLGECLDAGIDVSEGLQVAADIGRDEGSGRLTAIAAVLAAITGEEKRCRELAAEAASFGESRGLRMSAAMGTWALGLLELGLGRHEAALEHLRGLSRGRHRHALVEIMAAEDLVEAAVRTGSGAAAECLGPLQEWASYVRQPWADAVVLRCRALTGTAQEAEELFQGALRLHDKAQHSFAQARTELSYGEWLRRARRRGEAQHLLRNAMDRFQRLGAAPWVARALGELRASGDVTVPRSRAADRLGSLTPQELQVVRLAAQGRTNREIAEQLFLSVRTVGSHLYRAFPKLGVSSRGELGDVVRTD